MRGGRGCDVARGREKHRRRGALDTAQGGAYVGQRVQQLLGPRFIDVLAGLRAKFV